MTAIQVLTESDLREAVGLAPAELASIEAVYPLISSRVGSMPPVVRIDVPEHGGEIDIKAAYLPGYPGIAIKVSTGFFRNPEQGLPSLGGLMMVFDATTGIPRAALFDNGYLTDLRTALAGAVAAEHLAVRDARVAGILGAGAQARLQLEALRLVRPIERAVIWARRSERAEALAAELTAALDLEVSAVPSPAAAAAAADVLVTTTPATQPLLEASMLPPGLHVTAVGSDAEHKQELHPDVLETADLVVCDHREQSARLGELRAAVAAGFDPTRVLELGEVIDGTAPGRTTTEQITVCDLTGTGAQDTAIATLAVQRCEDAASGAHDDH